MNIALRKLNLLLLTAISIATCGFSKSTAEQIVGVWNNDQGQRYEFIADGSVSMSYYGPNIRKVSGEWKILSDGRIRTIFTAMGITKEQESELSFLDSNNFGFDRMVFIRAENEQPSSKETVTIDLPSQKRTPLAIASENLANELRSYRFTCQVKHPLQQKIYNNRGLLNEDGKTASTVLKALFFKPSIDPNESSSHYPDSSTPIGTFIAYANSHQLDGTIFETLRFYHPEESAEIKSKWKDELLSIASKWPRTCAEAKSKIQGYVEAGDTVYLINQGITIMRKKDESWYVSKLDEDDTYWIIRKAIEEGSIERVSSDN